MDIFQMNLAITKTIMLYSFFCVNTSFTTVTNFMSPGKNIFCCFNLHRNNMLIIAMFFTVTVILEVCKTGMTVCERKIDKINPVNYLPMKHSDK